MCRSSSRFQSFSTRSATSTLTSFGIRAPRENNETEFFSPPYASWIDVLCGCEFCCVLGTFGAHALTEEREERRRKCGCNPSVVSKDLPPRETSTETRSERHTLRPGTMLAVVVVDTCRSLLQLAATARKFLRGGLRTSLNIQHGYLTLRRNNSNNCHRITDYYHSRCRRIALRHTRTLVRTNQRQVSSFFSSLALDVPPMATAAISVGSKATPQL